MFTVGNVTFFCMGILSLTAVFAVFGPMFNDSLIQRVGLSLLCISSLGVAAWALKNDVPFSVMWFAVGQTIFNLASIFKRSIPHQRAPHPPRRTDT